MHAVHKMLRTGMRGSQGVYEDVASSIEPGQRCQMRERLSTASPARVPQSLDRPAHSMVDREKPD
ncbi:hypothetical protein J2X68_001878 [Streptomyces sp. 3330]|nr:hypothetical protein [Streptomyces sp. 3330]